MNTIYFTNLTHLGSQSVTQPFIQYLFSSHHVFGIVLEVRTTTENKTLTNTSSQGVSLSRQCTNSEKIKYDTFLSSKNKKSRKWEGL